MSTINQRAAFSRAAELEDENRRKPKAKKNKKTNHDKR